MIQMHLIYLLFAKYLLHIYFIVMKFITVGSIVPAEQVQACLSVVLSEPIQLKSEDCVGSLTSLERDQWAKVKFSCKLSFTDFFQSFYFLFKINYSQLNCRGLNLF